MRVVAITGALLLAGCSAIVSGGEDDPLRCVPPAPGQPDPCEGVLGPERLSRCVNELCVEVERNNEVCNDTDDDRDGIVDEGLDGDGDGFSSCPTAEGPLDCLDTNPDIHPPDASGQPDERCDGADNDCDGSIDEARRDGALCPAGQGCYPDRGGCDFTDCRLPEVGCPPRHSCMTDTLPATCVLVAEDCTLDGCTDSTQRCDPISLRCIDPVPLGAACERDIQCASDRCDPVAALGLASTHVGGSMKICSSSCCSDSDCPADAACWSPGTGARACVPRAILAMGSLGAPSARACQHAENCGGSDTCARSRESAYENPNRPVLVCRAPYASSDRVPCSSENDCESGLCVRYCVPVFGCASFCSRACRSEPDCAGDEGCRYLDLTASGEAPQYLQLCVISDGDSGGQSCNTDDQCIDDACIGNACRPTCCSDDQCGGDQCRPVSIHGRWEMHCLPTPAT